MVCFTEFKQVLKKAGNNQNTDGYLLNTGLEQTSISIPFGWHLAHKGIDAYISYFKANNGILRNSHIGNLQDLINQINRDTTIPIGDFTYNIENPRQEVSHILAKISAYYHFENLAKWTFNTTFSRIIEKSSTSDLAIEINYLEQICNYKPMLFNLILN